MIEIKVNDKIVDSGDDLYISTNIFRNNSEIADVDLLGYKWTNFSASQAFANCSNLTSVTNIADSIDDIGGMFYNCSSLTSTMPIPNSVTNKTYSKETLYNITKCYSSENEYNVMGYIENEQVGHQEITKYVQDFYYFRYYRNPEYDPYWYEDRIGFFDNGMLYTLQGWLRDYNDEFIYFNYDNYISGEHGEVQAYRNSKLDIYEPYEVYSGLYENCQNLTNANISSKNVTDLSYAFKNCENLIDVNINCPSLNNCEDIFKNSHSIVNVTLTGNNGNLDNMFENCGNLTNVNLNINASSLKNTFFSCYNLVNAPAIPNGVTSMEWTFQDCTNLVNAPVISNSVTNMCRTFCYCSNLVNAPEIPNSVTNIEGTFEGCSNLVNVPEIPNSVTNMCRTFAGCINLVNAPVIPNSLTSMDETFDSCSNLLNVPEIPNSVTNMYRTFVFCANLVNAPEIPNNVINMSETFAECYNLVNAPEIPNNVIDMSGTFAGCRNITSINIYSNNVTNMSGTFRYCNNLTNVNVNLNNVTNMSETFLSCINLTDFPDLSNCTKLINMSDTFGGCTSLVNAPVIPNNVSIMKSTFSSCSNLVNAPEIPNSVTNMFWTFTHCNNLSGNIFIKSEDIYSSYYCFDGTELEKKVYIPFILNMNGLPNMYGWYSEHAQYYEEFPSILYTLSEEIDENSDLFYINRSKFNISNIDSLYGNGFYLKNGPSYERNSNNDKIDGKYTLTYKSFIQAGYSEKQEKNGVILRNINLYSDFSDWTYTNEINGMKTLCNYIGTDTDVIISPYDSRLNDYSQNAILFKNNVNINSVDMSYINIVNNNLSQAFYGCSNLSNIINLSNTISNMSHTFDGCDNISGDIFYNWDNINDVTEIYGNTSNSKNVYINILGIDGSNTQTYDSFINAGYSTDVVKDGVTICDYQDYIIQDWTYDTLENGTKLLYQYTGNDIDISVPYKNTMINDYRSGTTTSQSNTPFYNNPSINNVDLAFVPFKNNSMINAFYNSTNLITAININQNVTNMYQTFYNCTNLINAPEIPNSVTDMYRTFTRCSKLINAFKIPDNVINMEGTFEMTSLINAPVISNSVINMNATFSQCYNLVNAPVIPNSVTNMYCAFSDCYNLINAPVIPNSVINMCATFQSCYNLVNVPEIPNGVTNMSSAFSYCRNLTGNIYIHSNNITNAYRCFQGTSLSKNVYIPFKYQNGVNTKTYNAFKQYYGSKQNGVTLRNISTI